MVGPFGGDCNRVKKITIEWNPQDSGSKVEILNDHKAIVMVVVIVAFTIQHSFTRSTDFMAD